MTTRLLSAGLLLVAVAVWVLVALPLRQETLRLGDEYRRLRDLRRQSESQTRGDLRDPARRRGTLVSDRAGVLKHARSAALECLSQAELGEARIEVKAAKLGSTEGLAHVRIQGAGSFAQVVKLALQLTREPAGFLLEQVSFTPRGERIEIAIEAYALGGQG